MRSKLVKTKDARRNMKRELTGHVVTRWYRAPEIILLEKDYGPGIDVWAVGCIFGEMLIGKALFQGYDEISQIDIIVKVLGDEAYA